MTEKDTVETLIAQYLAHEGFTETGNQFAHDVASQRIAAGVSGISLPPSIDPDDANVSHRQRIRAAILAGDIDLAFQHLGTFFPRVLEADSNRDIYFHLCCRKFIEMILKSYEAQHGLMAGSGRSGGAPVTNGNGKAVAHIDEHVDGMQLDTQNGDSYEFEDSMEMSTDNLKATPAFTETKSAEMIRNSLLSEAIQYGMGLQAEFSEDARPEVRKKLNDTFALIAYTDARESGLAEMMQGRERAEIAEQVNGAILGMCYLLLSSTRH